jgi:hypothetical protein
MFILTSNSSTDPARTADLREHWQAHQSLLRHPYTHTRIHRLRGSIRKRSTLTRAWVCVEGGDHEGVGLVAVSEDQEPLRHLLSSMIISILNIYMRNGGLTHRYVCG